MLFKKCKSLLMDYGLGVILSHRHDRKEECPIAFASRILTKAKKRFSQLEKKALSITFGVEKFRQYLLGRKFVLVKDNRPLIHIFSPHKPIPICGSSRIKRWSLKLAAFNYTVEFRKTSDNSNVDALSPSRPFSCLCLGHTQSLHPLLTSTQQPKSVNRFKGRFHISHRRLCGEGASIYPAIIDEHLTNLNSMLANSGYDPANIYNADETGLFFQLIPDRTLDHKDENCRGVKRMKQRITVLLCCNSTGTDKRLLLIIGKSTKPRCFRNFSPHFYCTYTSNSKAWMTSSIFQEWLLQFNKQLVSEERRILLFGIIKSFKDQYHKLQLQKMVELADAHLPTELRLDYAVRYCKMAWDSVSPDSISNCWNHTGIRFTSTTAVEPLNYGNLLDRIRDIFAITPENLMTKREFQLVDDSQEAEMKLTDDNFLLSTITAKEELGEDDDATVTQRLPSLREARTAAETVLWFLEHSKRATSDDVNLSVDLLRRVYAISEGEKTQVVITDFFKKITNGLAERYVREFKNLLRKNNGKDDLETNLQRFLFAHRAFPQTVIKEFPRGTANKEKFKINILEFNTKMGNPREVFHEAVRRQEQFTTTGCEVYFRNYATGPKWKKRPLSHLDRILQESTATQQIITRADRMTKTKNDTTKKFFTFGLISTILKATSDKQLSRSYNFYKIYMERLPRQQDDHQRPSLLTELSFKFATPQNFFTFQAKDAFTTPVTPQFIPKRVHVERFQRRVKAKTSFQDDDVPIDDDTTTKPLFTPQENGRKGTRDKVLRLRWNPWQKHVKSTSVSTIIASCGSQLP
ncbi:hypothetical protein LAZ67_12003658 [Cordylochernes scorpioides]|uniref:Transposase n=1 Tax=Cordylochernes scorpioides TaxID=51811 RepID=A0ABY6L2I3_9ARAC|nr:hypothetical protein LAZ67_12003658 [Cordylochernes scorpioides]